MPKFILRIPVLLGVATVCTPEHAGFCPAPAKLFLAGAAKRLYMQLGTALRGGVSGAIGRENRMDGDATDSQAGAGTVPPPGRASCDRQRILVVDDEACIRSVFQEVLQFGLPHCRVDLATNGAEAVQFFREARHGLLLMDLHMPVMNGEETFFQIQRICNAENWEMPAVVFCTGFNPGASIHNVVAAGRRRCLLKKPVPNDVLLTTLKQHLAPA